MLLNLAGLTLYPRGAITLAGGSVRPAAVGETVYNTEVVQHFPGRVEGKSGDSFEKDVAKRCLEQGFLDELITVVKPRHVFLNEILDGKPYVTPGDIATPPGVTLFSIGGRGLEKNCGRKHQTG